MRFVEFKNAITEELCRNPAGLTWVELKQRLDLPYERPCPEWVHRMEGEVGLSRVRGAGRAYVWKIQSDGQSRRAPQG